MTNQAATAGYVMNQTMLRVRDPEVTIPFYRDILGMTLLTRFDFEEMQFSLYFMGYLGDGETIPEDAAERAKWVFGLPALVEITHNWGTESAKDFVGYHDGNAEPQGFGHIGI
ncbi:MAG: VOC family protein, partial [Gammaproteobacteria bacterium]